MWLFRIFVPLTPFSYHLCLTRSFACATLGPMNNYIDVAPELDPVIEFLLQLGTITWGAYLIHKLIVLRCGQLGLPLPNRLLVAHWRIELNRRKQTDA